MLNYIQSVTSENKSLQKIKNIDMIFRGSSIFFKKRKSTVIFFFLWRNKDFNKGKYMDNYKS